MTFLNKTELDNLAYRELFPADHYMAMEELKDGGTVCINKTDDKPGSVATRLMIRSLDCMGWEQMFLLLDNSIDHVLYLI
jgi:hypothetical protein